jgi:hypothetical protein
MYTSLFHSRVEKHSLPGKQQFFCFGGKLAECYTWNQFERPRTASDWMIHLDAEKKGGHDFSTAVVSFSCLLQAISCGYIPTDNLWREAFLSREKQSEHQRAN